MTIIHTAHSPSASAHVDDSLLTRYVDGELAESERRAVAGHLAACERCEARERAESAARQLLRTHAAGSRARHEEPSWRPRVFRLGRPSFVASPARVGALAASGVAVAGLAAWLVLAPAVVAAEGVIGDSYCGERHRYTSGPGNEGDCTLRCVERGAGFVLVTDDRQVYRLEHEQAAILARFANVRVAITGVFANDTFEVATIASATAPNP